MLLVLLAEVEAIYTLKGLCLPQTAVPHIAPEVINVTPDHSTQISDSDSHTQNRGSGTVCAAKGPKSSDPSVTPFIPRAIHLHSALATPTLSLSHSYTSQLTPASQQLVPIEHELLHVLS